jgi:hypothetical protein
VNVEAEPVTMRPEPVTMRPEPVTMRPEPVEGHTNSLLRALSLSKGTQPKTLQR